MAGFLLHEGATVICLHGGQAMPSAPNPRVMVSGMTTATMTAPYQVLGCPGVPTVTPPCVIAPWSTGTTRVTSSGQPLVVQSGVAIAAPGGVPLAPLTTQTRVTAI